MKNLYQLGTLLLILCLHHIAYSQKSRELNPGYYVVVGAYAPSRENVAQNYTEVLNRRGIKADYGLNSNRNFYFVYLNQSNELKSSLREMQQTRKNQEFAKAWVRVIPGDIVTAKLEPVSKQVAAKQKEQEPLRNTTPNEVKPDVKEKSAEPVVPTNVNVTPTQTSVVNKEAISKEPDSMSPVITDNAEIKQYDKITLGNTEVFLSLYNATNNRIVDGNVKIIDSDRAKLLKEVKGNDYMYLPDPKNKSGQIILVCDAFGYRKVQQEINYPLPLADTVKDYVDMMGTTFIVSFDLVRYHKGDIASLYHVYFYNDAALMLPESKYELTSLLQMMQENAAYRIRLHGHTNGNYHGKIIMMGSNKNLFSLEGSKSTVGSAKDLSKARAEVIKEYLTENGIDPTRVEIKAWGGKRAIHDKHSVNAKKNVRVEVEILAE